MSAVQAGHDGDERSPRRGAARRRHPRWTTVFVAIAIVGGPTPAFAHGGFPPKQAKWDRAGSDVSRTYRVTSPPQGRRPGTPEHHAVRIWQELLNEHGLRAEINGLYTEDTERAVKAFQGRRGIAMTGRIDYPTARALLEPTIRREADAVGMSADLLCGHLDLESRLDPAAVGPTGDDLGLGQILLGHWNPGIDVQETLDEDFAIRYMAQRDIAAYRAFGQWPIAVFDYNSPTRAHAWKRTGKPSARGRSYSEKVLRGCDGPEFPGEIGATDTASSQRRAAQAEADLGRWLHDLSTSLGGDWEISAAK